jgi:hypothetical protein
LAINPKLFLDDSDQICFLFRARLRRDEGLAIRLSFPATFAKKVTMNQDINQYHQKQTSEDQAICNLLALAIDNELTEAESKIWHGHPVWFLDGNPIVGYSKQKAGIRLMFWSGADFGEDNLNVRGEKFKDASIFFNNVSAIDLNCLNRWLKKSMEIQWDYKNIVKRKGQLERLK